MARKKIVSGVDLINIGVPEGPVLGEYLDKLHFMLATGKLKSKAEAVKYIKREMTGEEI